MNKNAAPGETLQDKEDEGALVKDTYTYTNHGFSIESPKNITPKEVPNPRGNRTEIFIGDDLLTYVTDADIWESDANSRFEYKGEERVGSTLFKVYFNKLTEGTMYWFKQGKVGYVFSGDRELIKTFKFLGWPQIEGNKEDLVSFSIKPGQEVSGKMKVTGVLQGGYFFEGNLPVSILDADKVITKYGPGHGQATTDWMTSGPVSFEVNFDFSVIPKGKAYIKLTQDDPSGGANGFIPAYIIIPIVIK